MSVPDDLPVSIIEQRLREAFAAAAETVAPHSIGDLPRPADRRGRAASRVMARVRDCRRSGAWDRRSRAWDRRSRAWERRSRPPRFYDLALIPLAGAAAVALIATAMTVVVPKAFPAVPATGHGARPAALGTGAGHARPVAQARVLAAGYPDSRLPRGAAPRYFVGVRQLTAAQGVVSVTTLAVYSAVTGRVVASLMQPGRGRYYQAVAALGSDQTFVAAAVPQASQDCRTWFYRFSLGPRGRPTAWRALPVPVVTGKVRYNTALAASANGSVVAYSASMCTQNSGSLVGVIHLATRQTRTWSTRWPAMPRTLSLSANGGLLSFASNPGSGVKAGNQWEDAAWTLPTSAPPGPVAGRYRRVLHTPGGVQATLLSPTGKILFAMTASDPHSAIVSNPDVNAYDAATGKPLGLLQVVSYASDNPGFSSSASGRYALIYPAAMPFVQELDLVSGRLRTVPVAGGNVPLAAAW
jgi:hypothetical protein